MFVSYLECTECSAHADPHRLNRLCSECEAPLQVIYDLPEIRKIVERDTLSQRPPGLWRFREVLPLRDPSQAVSLGEGDTAGAGDGSTGGGGEGSSGEIASSGGDSGPGDAVTPEIEDGDPDEPEPIRVQVVDLEEKEDGKIWFVLRLEGGEYPISPIRTRNENLTFDWVRCASDGEAVRCEGEYREREAGPGEARAPSQELEVFCDGGPPGPCLKVRFSPTAG